MSRMLRSGQKVKNFVQSSERGMEKCRVWLKRLKGLSHQFEFGSKWCGWKEQD
jgi:hypothetical protein